MFLISSLKQSWTSVVPPRGARRAVEVAAVVIVSGLAMVLWPVERVTWENFDRIGIGMTRSEVRKLFVRWPDEQFVAKCRILGPNSFTWARTISRSGRLPASRSSSSSTTTGLLADAPGRARAEKTG
jgi:hypothetical protein